MDAQKDGLLVEVDAKLAEARKKARTVFEGLSNEGLEVQKGVLGAAQKDAAEINRKAKEELQAAAEKATSSLYNSLSMSFDSVSTARQVAHLLALWK